MSDVDTTESQGQNEQLSSKITQLQQSKKELIERVNSLERENTRYEQRIERLNRQNEKLKQPPNFVATVQEILPDNEVLIKQHGNNQEVVTEVTEERHNQLEHGARVSVDNSLNVVDQIEPETDVRAQVMQVDESPDVSFSDIGGLNPQIQELRETVEQPLINPEKFNSVGIEPPTGILLHGPPGTGKTLMAKAVANETDATMIQLSGSDLARKFIGEGAKIVRELFDYAENEEPAIIFIDEIDAVATTRTESKTTGDGEIQRTLMQLLNEMDGFEQRGDVSIIAATNRLDMLDDAVLRPGRFDRCVEVPEPDSEARREILDIHTRTMNLEGGVHMDKLVDSTEGLTGADMQAICTEAGMFAIRNNRTTITYGDFTKAIEKVTEENDDTVSNPSRTFY